MTPTIIHKARARQDVLDYGHQIATDDTDAAVRFVDAVDETAIDIARLPGLGHPWETENAKYLRMRWWPVKGFPRHLIFYREIDDGIEIIRVCHASRDLQRLFE